MPKPREEKRGGHPWPVRLGGNTVVDSGFLVGAGLVVIGVGVGTEATTTGDSSVLTFSVEEGCATAAGVGAAGFAYSCWTGFGLGAGGS